MKSELALLIDGDQGAAEQVAPLLLELEKTWIVSARVCIRNWRSITDQSGWEAAARECRLECIQHSPERRGKNATDIELTIRAMDLLHGSGYRAFCILSGDSDFQPLARRLERAGAHVELKPMAAAKPAPPLAAPPKAAHLPGKKAPAPIVNLVAAKPKPALKRKEPDSAGFARVVEKAFGACDPHGEGGVLLNQLGDKIPPVARKEAFGYPKGRQLRMVVESLPGFRVVNDAKGQPVVRRA